MAPAWIRLPGWIGVLGWSTLGAGELPTGQTVLKQRGANRGLDQGANVPGEAARRASSRIALPPIAVDPRSFEIRFTDDSTLRVTVLDERIPFATPYGKLEVPLREVRRIDLAQRVAADLSPRLDAAIKRLGAVKYEDREAAMAELLSHRQFAIAPLQAAASNPDPEIAYRAELLLETPRGNLSREQQTIRQQDLLQVGESRIAGKLVTPTIKVKTQQFGEQPIRLEQIASLRSLALPNLELENALPDPGNLTQYQGQFGRRFTFRVTGAISGAIWGDGVYSADSRLATAAVHAGALRAGEAGNVRVIIVPPPASFIGVTRNGVVSSAHGSYPGAFQIERPPPP